MEDNILKVEIGMQLPQERWIAAAENLEKVFPTIAQRLLLINYHGKGRQDADEFMADAMLAITAMRYVVEFAHDKCRFMAVPDKGLGE